MCLECAELLAFAEQWAVVAELEAAAIEQQVALGLSVPQAVRPLFQHELDAETRFADIQGMLDRAEAAAAVVLSSLQDLVGRAVVNAVFGDADEITPATLAAAVLALQEGQPPEVRQAIARTVVTLQGMLADVYAEASQTVTDEAVRQGAVPEGTPPLTVPDQLFHPGAIAVALYPLTRIMGKLYSDHVNPAATVTDRITRDQVESTIEQVKTDGAVDAARQAIQGAVGDGRGDTAKALAPSKAWASELLDGITCDPCKAVDGKEYETVEDAREDYPHGAYRGCKGGARCRGTLVFKFSDT